MIDDLSLSQVLGKRAQLGFVVRDLEANLKLWTEIFKVGPFVLFEESLGNRKFIHRNKQSDVRFSIALSYLGDLQIELMSPLNDAPSPYSEFLNQGNEGLHHVGFWPRDYEASCRTLVSEGFSEVSSIITQEGEKSISYFEGPKALGTMIELVPMTEERVKYFSKIQELTRRWDGDKGVIRFKNRTEFLQSAEYAALNNISK